VTSGKDCNFTRCAIAAERVRLVPALTAMQAWRRRACIRLNRTISPRKAWKTVTLVLTGDAEIWTADGIVDTCVIKTRVQSRLAVLSKETRRAGAGVGCSTVDTSAIVLTLDVGTIINIDLTVASSITKRTTTRKAVHGVVAGACGKIEEAMRRTILQHHGRSYMIIKSVHVVMRTYRCHREL
jgi:hypothetical protein